MTASLRVLLVFDTEAEAGSVAAAINARTGRQVESRRVQDEAALLAALRFADWDAVVSAYRPANLSYASILRILAADGREVPLILVATAVGEELAVEAVKAGAQDCVSVDRLDRLGEALLREIRDAETRRQRRRSDELLRYQACHDDLTGLLNRRTFMDRLHETLVQVRRSRVPASVCFMDLDRFKQVNDRCGHRAGDELLRQLASLMRQQVRESDTLARLGGDEFGLLLRDCGADQAVRVASELADRIRAFRFGWRDQTFDVDISIGIAAVSGEAATAAELLGAADAACYAAKAEGDGAIRCYHPDDADLGVPRGELRSLPALETALDAGAFVLVSQPLVDLHDAATEPFGQEVLLRMRGPDSRLASPAAFLPLAERSGLLPTIDRWVIRTVVGRFGARLKHDGARLPALYFLNVSAASLQEPGLADFIREEVLRAEVPPERLCFEITETAAVVNLSAAIELAHRLKTLGCRFALDDFGSGLSAFAYARRLPIDFLRIDGRLVREMLTDPIERAMVESIQRVGHLLGLRTIAESVETAEHLRAVRAIGIDAAQGYAVGRGDALERTLPATPRP